MKQCKGMVFEKTVKWSNSAYGDIKDASMSFIIFLFFLSLLGSIATRGGRYEQVEAFLATISLLGLILTTIAIYMFLAGIRRKEYYKWIRK